VLSVEPKFATRLAAARVCAAACCKAVRQERAADPFRGVFLTVYSWTQD